MTGLSECSPQLDELRGESMRTPDEVAAMLRLRALGWGVLLPSWAAAT